jgi:branched-chain amino acid transport system permease protein
MNRLVLAIGAAVVAALALVAVPWPEGYHIELMTVIFYWIALASCWNLMSGFTGYIDFGSATYVGVGSYVAGIFVVKVGWALPIAVFAAGVFAAILALIVGFPTLRLRGAYFAIATFALAEAMCQLAEELKWLTGGGMGLTLSVRLEDVQYYWVYLGLAALVVLLVYAISRNRMGYALKAIHQNEHAARQVGINTHMIKMIAYSTSAFFIGVLGSLDATRLGYFKPGDVFDVHITIKMVIMSLLGGMGTVSGPVVGATFLQLIEDFLGAQFVNLYLIIIGAVIVAVIMFLPQGISGSLRNLWPGLRRR